MNMKKTLILLFLIICYVQLSSQHVEKESSADSIYIIADDDFSNVSLFKIIVFNLIDSVFSQHADSLGCGRMRLFIRTNEFGRIDSCSIIESFRPDIDSLVVSVLNKLDFGNALVYTSSGVPRSMSFTLPIVLNRHKNSLLFDRKDFKRK